jgi:putative membrane protein
MLADTLLAVAHHLLAFGLLAILVAELVLLAATPDAGWRVRLARLDAGYGAAAGLLIAVGVGRLFWGAKGAAYFLENPLFWAKMALFAGVGLASVAPTLAILKWRRAADLPSPAEVAGLRRWLWLELGLFSLIPILAALMVRFGG